MVRNDAEQFYSLIKRFAEKDQDAMEDFCHEYEKLIYGAAASVVKSFLANEVVNDVLLKLWNAADHIGNVDKPLNWLYTVSRNCAKDRLRKEPRIRAVYEARKESEYDRIDSDAQFHDYLSILKEDEQKILTLKCARNLEFHEIAQELNMPTSSVSSRYYRAN